MQNSEKNFKKVLTIPYICGRIRWIEKGSFFFAVKFCEEKSGYNQTEVEKMRVKITLACQECKQRNYNTMKNKKNDPDRLEMNKYCRFCKKHTTHKETK